MEAAIKVLIENLRQQEKLYQDMCRLARNQLVAVTNSAECEMDGDLILHQKARLLEKIQLVRARTKVLETDVAKRLGLPEFSLRGLADQVDTDLHQRLAEAYSGVSQLLKQIVDLDDETTKLMRSRLSPQQLPMKQALQLYQDVSQIKNE